MKSPIEYIKESWGIYTKKENFIFFARIMAVLSILSFSIGFINSYYFPVDYVNNIDFSNIPFLISFILLSIISFVASLWGRTTTYMSIFNIGSDEKSIFVLGYKNMWKLFLISLVLGFIILLGGILLIVPAVIFGIWYSFSVYLVLDKKMGIKESLIKSKAMVKGRFFKIFGRYIVFGLFGLIVSIMLSVVPYIGSLLIAFIAPLFMLPGFLMYRDIVTNN